MNKSIPFDRIKLKSLAEFFQLPGRLFDKRHQQLISKRKSKLEHSANSSSSSSLQPQAESSLNVLNVLETSRVGENEELLNIIPFQECMYFVYKVKWPNSKLRIKSKVSNKKDIVQMIEVDMDIDNSMVFMNNYLEIYKYNRTLTDAERDDPAKSNKENFLV